MKIKKIEIIDNTESEVYDLEVGGNHNYFLDDGVLVHNCHSAASGQMKSKEDRKSIGTKFKLLLDKCVNASWRFGMTGTMPDEKADYYSIIGSLGPVVSNIGAKQLMDEGKISNLKIIVPFITYKDKKLVNAEIKKIKDQLEDEMRERGKTQEEIDANTTNRYTAEKRFLEGYLPRIKYIAQIVNSRLTKGENILILVNTVAFGEKLEKIFKVLCKDVSMITYIQGETKIDDRTEIRSTMEKQGKCVVIATTSLFSTGISVKRISSLILCQAGKSEIALAQSIGRTLRLSEHKEKAVVFDIVDDLTYSSKHSIDRLELYSKENFDHEILEIVI